MGAQKPKLRLEGEGSKKRIQLHKKMKKNKKASSHKKEKSSLVQSAAKLNHSEIDEREMKRSSGRKKRDKEKESKVESPENDHYNIKFEDETNGENGKEKFSRKRKANKVVIDKSGIEKADKLTNEVEGVFSDIDVSQENIETKTSKMNKKRTRGEKRKKVEDKDGVLHREVEDNIKEENAKLKDGRKKKKKDRALLKKDEKALQKKAEPEQNNFYEMSSGDEDCSKGMKKWITEYHQSRPGLEVLQNQIDDFITAHETQEEEARKDREAQAAEGGWTVVVHHKGRKKTTEAESGTTVGSVAPAAVMENMAKKKTKQVGTDFYRFQKREAQMNELMALQSKFEQDKKRIQQMRAARKFRPY